MSFDKPVSSLQICNFGVGSSEEEIIVLDLEISFRIARVSFGMPMKGLWALNRCYRTCSASFRVVLGLTTRKLSLYSPFYMVYVSRVNFGPSVKLGSELKLIMKLYRELVFGGSLVWNFRRFHGVRNIVYVKIELLEVCVWIWIGIGIGFRIGD